MIGIGGGGLVLGAPDDDAGVGFLHHMHQHVGVLVLGALGAIAFGIGVGGNVEGIVLDGQLNMPFDVLGEARIDLVQDILAIPKRPHFANGLVANPCDDAADVVHHGVDRLALVSPVLLLEGQAVADGKALAIDLVGHHIAGQGLMLHVVDAGPNIDQRLEHRVAGDVLHPLAVDPDLAAVTDRVAVLFACPDHLSALPTR